VRRIVVTVALLTASALGSGVASAATAGSGPCEQPAPVCDAYDTVKAVTAAEIAQAEADCAATFDSTPCPELATTANTVYSDVFFPYAVCWHVNSAYYCLGPIE